MNIFQPDGVANTTNPVTLLTLPRDERKDPHCSTTVVETTHSSSPSFVLLQLPLDCTVDDFINHTSSNSNNNNNSPNTYFVAAKANSSNNSETSPPETQQTQSLPQDAVCCVVESKGCCYTVHRIETSNTLIVIPPPTSSSPTLSISGMDVIHDASDIGDTGTVQQQQASKCTQFTQVLSAHTIQQKPSYTTTASVSNKATTTSSSSGSNGSYFLELRKKQLRLSILRRSLIVLDPYNNNDNNNINDGNDTMNHPTSKGRTVYDLAMSLQVSQSELQQGLHHIGAYAIPTSSSRRNQGYCLLADHMMNDCYGAIVTGLYTMSDCTDDYGGANNIGIIHIDPVTFIKNIAHHVQNSTDDDVTIINMESILLHCLHLLYRDPLVSNGKFILDVSKVRSNIFSCIISSK